MGKQQSAATLGASEQQTPLQYSSAGKQNQTIDQQMRDTQMSFASSTRQSLFSPGSSATRGMSPGGFGQSQYGGESGWGRSRLDGQAKQSQLGDESFSQTQSRRMMSLGEGGRRRNPGTNQSQSDEQYLANHPVSTLKT